MFTKKTSVDKGDFNMVFKCKYCGKEIDGVLPAPLTCWACYKKHETDSEVISAHQEQVNIKSSGSPTKECEMCNRVLPIDHFYKRGKDRESICKDCVVEEQAIRCLESLNVSNIRKMSSSGITASYLAEQTGRVRNSCQSMLNSLVKTERAHYKIVKGQNTFFMDSEFANELIDKKKSKSLVNTGKSTKSDIKVSEEGIWIKHVPIIKLDSILEEIRSTMDPDFSLNIKTEGEYADIFLSDDQMINWARMSFKHIISSFFDS
jgi:hypothetical protein